jgi:hypothetical protein
MATGRPLLEHPFCISHTTKNQERENKKRAKQYSAGLWRLRSEAETYLSPPTWFHLVFSDLGKKSKTNLTNGVHPDEI